MIRTADAQWQGSGKEGSGNLSTQSGILNHTQYSFLSRFEQGIGTNPEELVAAAHAGCFAMKLSFVLGEAGFVPETLKATAHVNLEAGSIIESHIVLNAKVPGISKDVFDACVKNAEVNCPISKTLNSKISVEATLEG